MLIFTIGIPAASAVHSQHVCQTVPADIHLGCPTCLAPLVPAPSVLFCPSLACCLMLFQAQAWSQRLSQNLRCRRPSRPDNPGSAKDQTGLPPPPSQPLPGPPEGSARRQGGAANGGQRQNRWAKEDTKGNEQWGKPDGIPACSLFC